MKLKNVLRLVFGLFVFTSCSNLPVGSGLKDSPNWIKPWFKYQRASVNSSDTFYWAISASNFDSKWKNGKSYLKNQDRIKSKLRGQNGKR